MKKGPPAVLATTTACRPTADSGTYDPNAPAISKEQEDFDRRNWDWVRKENERLYKEWKEKEQL